MESANAFYKPYVVEFHFALPYFLCSNFNGVKMVNQDGGILGTIFYFQKTEEILIAIQILCD
jgi:hypothetical protein